MFPNYFKIQKNKHGAKFVFFLSVTKSGGYCKSHTNCGKFSFKSKICFCCCFAILKDLSDLYSTKYIKGINYLTGAD